MPEGSCEIEIAGAGAVSPAGWGATPLCETVFRNATVATSDLSRAGWAKPMRVRTVPAAVGRNLNNPRLRRASPVTRFAVAAGLEALGLGDTPALENRDHLGLVLCVMTGCVNYSRRFYDEVLRDPGTASPLLFPETVFNAPSSHLASVLGAGGMNYTLVGDPTSFLTGLALAAEWLVNGTVDSCLVIGAEEMDWIVADSFRLFNRSMILAEGAGALLLRRVTPGNRPSTAGPVARTEVRLHSITEPHLLLSNQSRERAAHEMRGELPPGAPRHLLCDGIQGLRRLDADEEAAWCKWEGLRISPKRFLGEGLTAAAAWQCVLAVHALQQGRCAAASVSVVGSNQQALGAHFVTAAAGSASN